LNPNARVGYQDGSVDQIEQFGILLSVFCENIPRYMPLRFTCIIAGILHDSEMYFQAGLTTDVELQRVALVGRKRAQVSSAFLDGSQLPGHSSVCHSDAYYTERRGYNWRLLSLKPELTNALKCTRSWKFGYVRNNIRYIC
ncbi:hypothetical protein SOVF_200760, partial [Spinacia oleracea]